MDTNRVICGFQWKGDEITHENLVMELHVHECQIPNEHEEFRNAEHVCYCGDYIACERDEKSYDPTWPITQLVEDDEVPF